jgi:ribosomal small subunit protein bTHX
MGRGDQRSKKGKIHVGSYGKSRPRPAKIRKAKASSASSD